MSGGWFNSEIDTISSSPSILGGEFRKIPDIDRGVLSLNLETRDSDMGPSGRVDQGPGFREDRFGHFSEQVVPRWFPTPLHRPLQTSVSKDFLGSSWSTLLDPSGGNLVPRRSLTNVSHST